MNTDTHVDIDTLEVSPEEDLLTETDDLDNDEDLEVEYDDDGEGASADTKPTETQPQNEPTQDPTQQPEAETFTLKYKGQENKYTREQLLELASKGLDYDGLRADRDRLRDNHPALAILDRYAKQNGMTREQYMEFAQQKADEAEAAPVIRQLMDSGVPEAAAKELALRRLQESRGQETQRRQEQEAQEIAEFHERFESVLDEYLADGSLVTGQKAITFLIREFHEEDAYYTTDYCGVVVLKEPFTLEAGLAERPLEQYIKNVIENNGHTNIEPQNKDGLWYYVNYNNSSYRCVYSYAYKGTDAFYVVQYIINTVDEETLKPVIHDWAKVTSVK